MIYSENVAYIKQIINQYPALTDKEIKELLKKGDEESKHKVFLSNLRLVLFVAKKYFYNSVLEFEDIIQEGCVALLKAIVKFNPESDTKFSTYATVAIKNHIERALIYAENPRLPVHIAIQVNQNIIEDPRPAVVSTQQIFLEDNDNGLKFEDIVSDENTNVADEVIDKLYNAWVWNLIDETTLTERNKEIVKYYFKSQKSSRDVGNMFNMTAQNVRRIVHSALRTIKNKIKHLDSVERSKYNE